MCHNTSCSAKEETLFLRKIFDWGKFSVNTRQLYFHCRCQHGAWPRQRNTFIIRIHEDCNRLDQMWVQLPVTKLWLHRLNLKWKWSQMPTLTNVQQTHMHRNYLCLASMSLSMPLRLREGDLHWKCDGNEAVATVSVTVSDNTYCKAPVYNHTQIVRPAWDTQPVICSIYCQSHWQGIKKMMERKSDFCERCHFSFLL